MAGAAGGPFTGLYQGQSGAADASAALKPLLPNISVYQQGPSSAPALQNQITVPAPSYSGGGALSSFEHFLGGLGSQVGHLAAGAASWLGHNALNMAEAPIKLGEGLGHGILDRLTLDDIQKQNQQISDRIQTLAQQYKSGLINSKQYQMGLKSIGQDSTQLDKESAGMVNKVTIDQKSSTEALINTAAGIVTILTAGFGAVPSTTIKAGAEGVALEPTAAKGAADWLASNMAKPMLEPVANTINRLATDSRLFQGLDVITQKVLQRSTAEVVAQSTGNMTAGQIARATAANVALKYPIYFNYMSGTAGQVYSQLDQAKYGDAVRTLAFNALLLLSGGPIGQALKYGGKAITGITDRTFGQTSFWDELSKFYGDQSPSGFAMTISKMAKDMAPADRAEFIKNLAAVEVTNVNATAGDAVAAAFRLAKGEQAKSLTALTEVSHEQAINDMVRMAKNFRVLNDAAQKAGIGPIAVGRFDARSKGIIADAITKAEDTQGRLQAWEQLKAANPNDALANNPSLDKQITEAINKFDNSTELRQYVMKINAQTTVEGIPKSITDAAAKEGYIPIRPRNLEAPFREGSGSLLTAHGEGEDFFTKAVQPLPILGSIGTMFTNLGLSPQASSERVYQYFTDNLSRNLEQTATSKSIEKSLAKKQADKEALKGVKATSETGLTKDELALLNKQGITPETHPDIFKKAEIKGEAPTETPKEVPPKQISATDYIIKRLSNYAKQTKIPTQDLRMLTNKDVRTALSISGEQASEIQAAIVRSHLQVPLAVRGMGDRAVDWTYGLPGYSSLQRRYLRLQGALRFSWNPFFEYLRLIPKTEILSEAEGGGFVRSVFTGRLGVISEIRNGLRAGGLLDQVGKFGSVQSGEAAGFEGTIGRNLTKKLAPGQEISIAGLIDSQAQRMGMDWRDFVTQFPHETADTIQRIAEYSRTSSFLNSPLARTLNIAIFPFRFDVKVATIMGKSLARTSLLTQTAFINGMMKAHTWLNSPEGQAWYAKNSDAIGLFNYITPFARMNEVMQSLLPGGDHHLGNFGEIGGLPFGWIQQILDSEGLTHFNQTGTDAHTGQAFPDYIPKDARGQAAIALQDFLSSLFSYPGATVGLPSKNKAAQSVAFGILGANKTSDFTKETPSLSADQQRYKQNIEQATGQTQPPPNYQASPPNTFDVTPTSPSAASEIQPKIKSSSKKLKKSDYPVMLPPGQTQVGVL